MSLELRANLAARGLQAQLSVPHGTTLALIGPNGSGKSTALAVVAGLVEPDSGEVEIDGRTVYRGPPNHRMVAPHRRRVALLTQDPSLFPHLDVLDNVAFGPRAAGARKGPSRQFARDWLERFDAMDLADRRPSQLSGGQAQRVALARALAARPSVLLLDEPLSSMDVGAAARLRTGLRGLLAGVTAVVVTHDVLDALLLADEVAVLEAGRVVEAGPAKTVMARPRSSFAAEFFGWNQVRGSAVDGRTVVTPQGHSVRGVAKSPLLARSQAVAAFRPGSVRVAPQPSPGEGVHDGCNRIAVRLTALEPNGHLVRLRAGDLSADLAPDAVADLGLGPGAAVEFEVRPADVSLYPA